MACWPCLLTPSMTNQKVVVCHSRLHCTKTLASILPALSCSLACSLDQMPFYELSYGQAHKGGEPPANSQQGTEALVPTVCEELNLANTYLHELGSRSFPSPALGWLQSQLTLGLWETLSQRTLRSHGLIPDWNCEMIMFAFFKPLSFGTVCYTALNNHIRQLIHTKKGSYNNEQGKCCILFPPLGESLWTSAC